MDEGIGSGDPVGDRPVSDVPVDPPDETELGGSARALLEAFVSISSDLDTRSVLLRIVQSACELTGAKYGAIGVAGHDGGLADVVTHGMDQQTMDRIGELPVGKGLLDLRALGTEAVRTRDLTALPQSAGFPPGHPPMKTLLMVPIRVRGTAFGQLYLTEKRDGTAFDQHDEMLVQSLSSVAGFVIENARAYGVSERRRRWLEMFGELSERLTPPITIPDALDRIAASLLRASGAHSTAVVQVPEDGEPFPAAACGDVLQLDAEDQEVFDSAVRAVVESGHVSDILVREDWVAVLAPLKAHLTMPGVLILTHPRLGRPDALEERELLSSFAEQAGLALDRAQALQDREQLAVISDRDRIARELHDVVIQRLFATGLHMQSIRSAATSDDLRERIDQSVRDLDQTIRDIRGTIFQLQTRPRNSLRTDVRDTVREMVPRLGFAPSVQTHGPVDNALDAKIQQQLVAVLREALTNVAQHARASAASVELQVTPTHLRLKVSDNGKGLAEDRVENGLRSVRRRAMLLGGSLDLWPNEPTGTVFVWSVPYDGDESGS